MTTPNTSNNDNKIDKKKSLCLRHLVSQALEDYFKHLDGYKPHDLYALVLNQVEETMLKIVLEKAEGNQSKAAQTLGISRGTLRKKLQEYKGALR